MKTFENCLEKVVGRFRKRKGAMYIATHKDVNDVTVNAGLLFGRYCQMIGYLNGKEAANLKRRVTPSTM